MIYDDALQAGRNDFDIFASQDPAFGAKVRQRPSGDNKRQREVVLNQIQSKG